MRERFILGKHLGSQSNDGVFLLILGNVAGRTWGLHQ